MLNATMIGTICSEPQLVIISDKEAYSFKMESDNIRNKGIIVECVLSNSHKYRASVNNLVLGAKVFIRGVPSARAYTNKNDYTIAVLRIWIQELEYLYADRPAQDGE